jgi:hypothetical protein
MIMSGTYKYTSLLHNETASMTLRDIPREAEAEFAAQGRLE